MIADRPVVTGSCFALLVGLMLCVIAPAKQNRWIAEIQGESMSPTLWGERVAFRCRECGGQVCVSRLIAQEQPLIQCDSCKTWQVLPEMRLEMAGDRVVMGPISKRRLASPGQIVAIDHPVYGLTIKRVAKIEANAYFVVGDNQDDSMDSRIPTFGLVPADQIRGIVVKILPNRSLARAKRSR